MSDAVRRALGAFALTCAFAGTTAAQEDLARLRAELAEVHAREKVADSVFRAMNRNRTVSAETLEVAGISVRVTPAGFPRKELDPIATGIVDGLAGLERKYGTTGRALIDTAQWRVSRSARLAPWAQPILLEAGRGASRTEWRLNRPVTPSQVERFISRRAGERLAFRSAPIGAYAGFGFALAPTDTRLALAAREMSVSASGVMRRCARGSIPDCRRLLSPPSPGDTLAAWYDPTEHQVAVTFSASNVAPTDPRRAQRTACFDGDEAACTSLATTLTLKPPYSTLVRHTFVEHSLDVGGPGTVDSLLAAPGGDPIALLARASGVAEDSLIAGWQRRAAAALEAGRDSPFVTLLSSMTWGVIFFGIAARKRGEIR
jgi:hypothetical protein